MKDTYYPQSSQFALVIHKPCRIAGWAIVLFLTACASDGSRPNSDNRQTYGLHDEGYREPTALSERSNEVLMRAIGLVGTPYRYGGDSPDGGFDCSGLVGFVFRDAANLILPRSTRELVDIDAMSVNRDDLQPGDLVFFNPRGGRISHIGIYVGEGRFVHAPATGGTVRLDSLDSTYWRKCYASAKRILR